MVGLLEKQMKKEKIIKIVFVAYNPKKTGDGFLVLRR